MQPSLCVLRRKSQSGMRFHEVMQNVQQGTDVLLIASALGCPHIVGDHVADYFASVLSVKQVLSEASGDYLRHMLVLGDGQDLVLVQSAKGDALLQGDHDTSSTPALDCALS